MITSVATASSATPSARAFASRPARRRSRATRCRFRFLPSEEAASCRRSLGSRYSFRPSSLHTFSCSSWSTRHIEASAFGAVALGGVSCPLPNRARCHRLGLGEREEQLFLESWREKNCLSSAASALRFGLTRLRRTYRSAPASPSAPRTCTSTATASRLTRRSWLCLTNYGLASGPEKYPAPTGLQASGVCGPERVEFGAPISCGGGAAAARLAHNQEVEGASPSPATSSGDREQVRVA